MHAASRRRFIRTTATLMAAGLAGCASPAGRIDATRALAPVAGPRRDRPGLLPDGASFLAHINRGAGSGVATGGVDYAPAPGETVTEVCPSAAGVVINGGQTSFSGGTYVTVAHGLGWKTEYYHLERRLTSYGARVGRRDVIGIMGSSGWGAARGAMGVVVHTHLTLWGPAYCELVSGVVVQDRPQNNVGFRHALDPEAFSMAGALGGLVYSRAEDSDLDAGFRDAHLGAVAFADSLLDRIPDPEAARTKARTRGERDTGLDFHLDQRLWWLWRRLQDGGGHPFTSTEAAAHRARLLELMSIVPRLTAPIVEPRRAPEYRRPPA